MQDLTEKIIGACIEVHRQLGPGLLEAVYEECVCKELKYAGIQHERQAKLPLYYKGDLLEVGYRMDLVVDESVVIEIKAVEHILPVHEAQLITYLKLSKMTVGLLINFNVPLLKDGIKRLVNNYGDPHN